MDYGYGVDPLDGSPWSAPATVAGFEQSPPNDTLMRFAAGELQRPGSGGIAVDIGCGAGRNAAPLARAGWTVVGLDLSVPMVEAARRRIAREGLQRRFAVAVAPLESLPVRDAAADLAIAHGIWNLARSADEFRAGVREAGRVVKPGGALFVFTFSRQTLPPDVEPVANETFVFTDFSGEPQVFLTEEQLVTAMAAAGFAPDAAVPLREHNRPAAGMVRARGVPVIYEAAFRRA